MLHELVLRGKLHFIYNEREELLNFMINPDDVNDHEPLEYKSFVEFIYEKSRLCSEFVELTLTYHSKCRMDPKRGHRNFDGTPITVFRV